MTSTPTPWLTLALSATAFGLFCGWHLHRLWQKR